MIRDNRAKLGIDTPGEAFDRTIQETQKMLRNQTARITVDWVTSDLGGTTAEVSIENLSGHKFPTAYPSRRVWIELIKKDNLGRAVFSSKKI